MKKFLLLISLFIFSIVPVKAENTGEGQTTINTVNIYTNQSAYNWFQSYNTFICLDGTNCSYSDAFNQLYTYYENNLQNNFPYYVVSIIYGHVENIDFNTLRLYYFEDNTMSFDYNAYPYIWFQYGTSNYLYFDTTSPNPTIINTYNDGVYDIFGGYVDIGGSSDTYTIYTLYDSNFDIISERDYEIANFYNDNSNLVINTGDKFPKIKNLLDYSSWSDYENNHLDNYTTVNLDDYEYVLLTLKNYNQSNAFQTNFQVKGQIGITPIYNYGQTSKDSVTGVQVQDRCNTSYSDFTTYPFYILQTDLQNNVVYAVKSCSSNSSFKFDNTIFNIFYVTQSNLNNPTVTINGNTYNVIPYADLPSTATKNEQDNYIPGESINIIDSNTDGLNSAIKNAQSSLANIWSTFSYFTSFVTQIFTSLPSELHAILLTAFTLTIIIGLIKHFTG